MGLFLDPNFAIIVKLSSVWSINVITIQIADRALKEPELHMVVLYVFNIDLEIEEVGGGEVPGSRSAHISFFIIKTEGLLPAKQVRGNAHRHTQQEPVEGAEELELARDYAHTHEVTGQPIVLLFIARCLLSQVE